MSKKERPKHPYKTIGCVFNHRTFYANTQVYCFSCSLPCSCCLHCSCSLYFQCYNLCRPNMTYVVDMISKNQISTHHALCDVLVITVMQVRRRTYFTAKQTPQVHMWPILTKGVLSHWDRYELQAKKWGSITTPFAWLSYFNWPQLCYLLRCKLHLNTQWIRIVCTFLLYQYFIRNKIDFRLLL